jgi:hypothetical protein
MHRLKFGLTLWAAIAALIITAPSWAAARKWVMIDGTDSRWWIDSNSISKIKLGMFFVTMMNDTRGALPVSPPSIPVIMALDCATGERYQYSEKRNKWEADQEQWGAAYDASVRRIVCKN